jgi:hypothetical protein
MNIVINLYNSKLPTKKYDAIIYYYDSNKIINQKKINFGAKGYSDYTIHKDPKRKDNYIKRHQVNEDWSDLEKAGTWSRYILWNKPTLNQSIKDMEQRFKVKIINMTN